MSPSRATTRRALQARDDPRLPPIRPFGSDVQLDGAIFRSRKLVLARETRVPIVPEAARTHAESDMTQGRGSFVEPLNNPRYSGWLRGEVSSGSR
jgi:hypothetical protein